LALRGEDKRSTGMESDAEGQQELLLKQSQVARWVEL
jgi:hypothetical protein